MNDINAVYAPVVIVTCNRYKHLQACIESLRDNELAAETEIFIGLDYPPSLRYEGGYQKVEEYLNLGINGFKKVNIIKRTHNLGAIHNLSNLLELVMKKYDRWIVTEDDNVFSKDFLNYMNYYLELFKNDTRVFSIGGHTYSQEEHFFNEKEEHIYARHAYNAWGSAFWTYKWQEGINFVSNEWIELMICKSSYIKSFKMPRRIKRNIVSRFLRDDWELCDTTITFYLWFMKKYQVFPSRTKVKNNGFDGLGIHAANDKERNEGTFENCKDTFSIEKADNSWHEVDNNYYSLSYGCNFQIKNEIIYYAIHLLGFKKARKLLEWLKLI